MKRYEFDLPDLLYKQACEPIRDKYKLLTLLVQTIKYLIITPISSIPSSSCEHKLIVYVDKMSRLLYCMKDKIFSFQFPLKICESNDEKYISIQDQNNLIIDSKISSFLLTIFQSEDIKDSNLSNKVAERIIDYDLYSFEHQLNNLVKYLIMFEPGYIRYDNDIVHINGMQHPEYHLDLFYSENSTMKLGLHDSIDYNWLLDIMNTKTNCKYIST